MNANFRFVVLYIYKKSSIILNIPNKYHKINYCYQFNIFDVNKCLTTYQKIQNFINIIKSKKRLNEIFMDLQVNQEEVQDILKTKCWDMKSNIIKDFVIKV